MLSEKEHNTFNMKIINVLLKDKKKTNNHVFIDK